MHAYIRFVTQAVRDLTPQQLHAVRERYVREFICPHVLPPALDLLQRHRDAGDTLLITTATNRFIAGAGGCPVWIFRRSDTGHRIAIHR
jgi:phosphoserine phosphatase